MPDQQTTPLDPLRVKVEDLARQTDRAPWMVARSLAKMIEARLLTVADGTPEEAAASLRNLAESYANAR